MASRPPQGLSTDLAVHYRTWRLERRAWLVSLLVLIAALLGLFGSGPLANAEVNNGVLRLQYHRFERLQSSDRIRVVVASNVGDSAHLRLWLRRNDVDPFRIEQVTPTPDKVELGADRLVFNFSTLGETRPGEESTAVVFDVQAATLGLHWIEVGIVGHTATLRTWQWVFP